MQKVFLNVRAKPHRGPTGITPNSILIRFKAKNDQTSRMEFNEEAPKRNRRHYRNLINNIYMEH
jgi:hypothetical protein